MSADSETLLTCIPRLRRYARALVGDRTAADDLVQDTLERAWGKFSLWRRGSDMRAWLFGIMHNLHVDQRRKPRLDTQELDEEASELASPASPPDALALRDLQSALSQLPDEQREVLLLVALQEMSYEQVASTLGIPVGTVMSRLSRGRERLRLLMDGRAASVALKVVK
ncbi:RNA polymerase subunit sigma-24 [Pseudomonas taeanensis MS-3]|uniref:RNA polymerase subunit sigma-24 n=1 Tax=Pseudomonas taeanensis MS-3 TaxID=1395571 RepID=A0A0A1YLY6_9PSED|nr:RNA polymerase sigma factor [Pseudomonas taeanensis]KFX69699.1 RNA polymerase subunit sigma-24 [Pseudomonas taeanensis MS-3]